MIKSASIWLTEDQIGSKDHVETLFWFVQVSEYLIDFRSPCIAFCNYARLLFLRNIGIDVSLKVGDEGAIREVGDYSLHVHIGEH